MFCPFKNVLDFITSPDFFDGKYADKTIIVHSNQRGAEREENVQKLLEVEKIDNPVIEKNIEVGDSFIIAKFSRTEN